MYQQPGPWLFFYAQIELSVEGQARLPRSIDGIYLGSNKTWYLKAVGLGQFESGIWTRSES